MFDEIFLPLDKIWIFGEKLKKTQAKNLFKIVLFGRNGIFSEKRIFQSKWYFS